MNQTQASEEIVFAFTLIDDSVAAEAAAAFGEDEVSASKQMTGGEIVSVFLKPIVEALGKVLDFKAKQGNRITHAKLVIGKEQISLEGFGAEDAERLLASGGFQQALAQLHRKDP